VNHPQILQNKWQCHRCLLGLIVQFHEDWGYLVDDPSSLQIWLKALFSWNGLNTLSHQLYYFNYFYGIELLLQLTTLISNRDTNCLSHKYNCSHFTIRPKERIYWGMCIDQRYIGKQKPSITTFISNFFLH
jgi:hypothetical protein